jgi:hypothetical protein
VPSTIRHRAPRRGRIDGLAIRVVDDPAASAADVGHALRLLARLLVRSHQAHADHEAIIPTSRPPSPLTRAAFPRTDHTDEAA